MAINKQFLKILICPQCGGKVHYDEKQDGMICDQCQLLYEIKNDIPNMLTQQAHNLNKKQRMP